MNTISKRLGITHLETVSRQIIQRAGRLTRPQGKLTLTMSPNTAVKQDLLFLMDALQKAA